MSEKIPISCIGDGFRYEYYEGTNKDKHITSGYGPLTHKLKFQVSVDGIDKEFMINDISCTETYDKIASNAFENELDQKDRLDSSTTLYQYMLRGKFYFDTLELNEGEKFELNYLMAKLIIPVGELFKTPGVECLIYNKESGEKVILQLIHGEYDEKAWPPISATYDDEIEHYINYQLSINQIIHSQLLFGEHPDDVAQNYDDISYVESVVPLVKDPRFKLPFLESLYKTGIETWIKNDIFKDVLNAFKENPNSSEDLINQFENRIEETEKIEKSQSIEKSSSPPIDPIESFREFMAGEFSGMKLPKNKNYGEYVIGSGMLICFMAKKSSVSTYLYSSGKLPAKKVFEKINSLGLSGKVINDKYTLTPMPGSRNPNVVRIDIEIEYDSRDLNSAEMRAEVKDVYGQLLELCKPLA